MTIVSIIQFSKKTYYVKINMLCFASLKSQRKNASFSFNFWTYFSGFKIYFWHIKSIFFLINLTVNILCVFFSVLIFVKTFQLLFFNKLKISKKKKCQRTCSQIILHLFKMFLLFISVYYLNNYFFLTNLNAISLLMTQMVESRFE